MRFSLASVFSTLTAIATVSAFPVTDEQSDVICCVAPGVPAGCDASYADHYSLQSVLTVQSAYELAKKHPDQFLSQYVFEDLFVDEFRYGTGKGGNIKGSNMISGYITEPAGETKLAIHINSIVTASALQKNKMQKDEMTIDVTLFHLTARSVATQQAIDAHGPSTITAAKSIHIGVNQASWGPTTNVQNLHHEIGVDPLPALQKQGYNTAHVVGLTRSFRTKVTLSIHRLLGGDIVVHWKGDKSFPTE